MKTLTWETAKNEGAQEVLRRLSNFFEAQDWDKDDVRFKIEELKKQYQ